MRTSEQLIPVNLNGDPCPLCNNAKLHAPGCQVVTIQADARRAGLMEAAAIADRMERDDAQNYGISEAIERAAEESGK